MKIIREAKESEVILSFLKGELQSKRFHDDLVNVLNRLGFHKALIEHGSIEEEMENLQRVSVMKEFRGYPDKKLFEHFPTEIQWRFAELDKEDIDTIYYINYSYWNELSNGTSKPAEAAKTIKGGREIFGVSNQPFLDGVEYSRNHSFMPVILLTCNDTGYLLIEGHSRMTVYGLVPEKLKGSNAYIGYTTQEQMKQYDGRTVNQYTGLFEIVFV